MKTFIFWHVLIGFALLGLAFFTALFPKVNRSKIQSLIAKAFFVILLITAFSGIIIGIYRHPTYVSPFQIVTFVGIVFGVIGLLAEAGKMKGFRKQSNHFWYINGLGGSLIATSSASLFFIALTYFPDFYKANIILFGIVFIAAPVIIGREFIKKELRK